MLKIQNGTKMKILVIDDEEFFAQTLTRLLSKGQSHEVTYVTSAKDALDIINRIKYDLIICDLRLPDDNDGGLIMKISSIIPEQDFFIISAYEIPKHLLENKELNIRAYFEKPFDVQDMEVKINELLFPKSKAASN